MAAPGVPTSGLGAPLVAVDLRTTFLPAAALRSARRGDRRRRGPRRRLAARGAFGAAVGAAAAFAFFSLAWRLTTNLGFGDVRLALLIGAVAGHASVAAWTTALLAGTVPGRAARDRACALGASRRGKAAALRLRPRALAWGRSWRRSGPESPPTAAWRRSRRRAWPRRGESIASLASASGCSSCSSSSRTVEMPRYASGAAAAFNTTMSRTEARLSLDDVADHLRVVRGVASGQVVRRGGLGAERRRVLARCGARAPSATSQTSDSEVVVAKARRGRRKPRNTRPRVPRSASTRAITGATPSLATPSAMARGRAGWRGGRGS